MAIKARNIIVGGLNSPTNLKEKVEPKQVFGIKLYGNLSINSEPEPKPEKSLLKNPEPTKVTRTVVEEEPSRYVEKKDGELIRNINTKSHYLKDMVDFEN